MDERRITEERVAGSRRSRRALDQRERSEYEGSEHDSQAVHECDPPLTTSATRGILGARDRGRNRRTTARFLDDRR